MGLEPVYYYGTHAEVTSDWQMRDTGARDARANFHFKLYVKVHFHSTVHTMLRK